MSSPFETPQEFLEVEGPLYTFADNPIAIAIFLILRMPLVEKFNNPVRECR